MPEAKAINPSIINIAKEPPVLTNMRTLEQEKPLELLRALSPQTTEPLQFLQFAQIKQPSSKPFELERARKNATTPLLRKELTALAKEWGVSAINGEGRHFAIMEPEYEVEGNTINHNVAVQNRINGTGEYDGLATGAKYEKAKDFYPTETSVDALEMLDLLEFSFNNKDNPKIIEKFTDLFLVEIMTGANDSLKKLEQSETHYDAINMSMTYGLKETFRKFNVIIEKQEFGEYDHANLIKKIYGSTLLKQESELQAERQGLQKLKGEEFEKKQEALLEKKAELKLEKEKKTVLFMAKYLTNEHQGFKTSIEQYRELTEKLWKKGTIPVVASGNTEKADEFNLAWLERNILAQGHVLIVGASDTNETPKDMTDDKVASFSYPNPFTGKLFLLAPGAWVAHGDGKQKPLYGTSIATPYVVSGILLMRQVNPKLSSDEVVEILQKTAVKTGVGLSEEGAGHIDILAAVKQAHDKK